MVIRTKYRGPTDTKPGRIIATAGGCSARPRRAVTEYSHALSSEQNHAAAAMRLAAALDLPGEWVCGEDAGGVRAFVRLTGVRYRATPTFAGWSEVPA